MLKHTSRLHSRADISGQYPVLARVHYHFFNHYFLACTYISVLGFRKGQRLPFYRENKAFVSFVVAFAMACNFPGDEELA